MHTDASGAEPESIHACAVGSDAFVTTNGFAEVLCILDTCVKGIIAIPFRSKLSHKQGPFPHHK
jgi:hypothetical protein